MTNRKFQLVFGDFVFPSKTLKPQDVLKIQDSHAMLLQECWLKKQFIMKPLKE